MKDVHAAAYPARCRHCRRLFCEKEVPTCFVDCQNKVPSVTFIGCNARSKIPADKQPLETIRQVALITCVFCTGRELFLNSREDVFKSMVRKVFPGIREKKLSLCAQPSSVGSVDENKCRFVIVHYGHQQWYISLVVGFQDGDHVVH